MVQLISPCVNATLVLYDEWVWPVPIQIEGAIECLKTQLEEKGKEINAFREKHGIRIQGDPADTKPPQPQETLRHTEGSPGVLVS